MWGTSWDLDLLFDKRTDSLFALEWSTRMIDRSGQIADLNAVRIEAISELGIPTDTTDGLLWSQGREAIGLITMDSVILIRRGYAE